MKLPPQLPPKYNISKNRSLLVLPSPIVKKDLTDYEYGLNIDKKILELATDIASKVAIATVRETLSLNLDELVDKICNKIIDRMPAISIRNLTEDENKTIKKDMDSFVITDTVVSNISTDSFNLRGELGRKIKTNESTEDALDALGKLL